MTDKASVREWIRKPSAVKKEFISENYGVYVKVSVRDGDRVISRFFSLFDMQAMHDWRLIMASQLRGMRLEIARGMS